MAENILKLKKRATAAGMPKAEAMKADRAKLNAFLAESENGSGTKTAAKKAVKKAVKKSARTKAPAAKSEKSGKAKRPSPAKPARKAQTRKPASRTENKGMGRLSIDKSSIDWSVETDGWKPRKGGAVERLFKALKKSKGNIDKAYGIVSDSPFDFVGKTKRNGEKRTKAEIEKMLRYRLNRTLFDFAVATGQHAKADSKNRVEYGTGKYAKPKPKRKVSAESSTKASKKAAPKKTGAKRGRPKGSTNKKKAAKK